MNKTFISSLSIIFISSLILLTSSCNPWIQVEDMSHESNYNKVIGKVYSTQQSLKLCGIKRDLSKDTIDLYGMYVFPGASGPEVVQLGILETGSHLRVVQIVRTVPNFLIEQRYRFVVEILNNASFKGTHFEIIPIYGAYSKHHTEKDMFILNPSIFKEI